MRAQPRYPSPGIPPPWFPNFPGGALRGGSLNRRASPPLSRTMSPGRFRAQNLVVLSWLVEARTWPTGCHASPQMALSWAPLIAAIGLFYRVTQKLSVPSELELTNMSSCTGCHWALVTSLLWAR